MLKTSLALLIVAASAGTALAAASPVGRWRVQDDNADIRIANCGRGTLCGYARNGEVVLDHMRKAGPNAWTGIINDSRSGSRYDGTISLISEGQLRVHGCLQGGGMCGDQTWSRLR